MKSLSCRQSEISNDRRFVYRDPGSLTEGGISREKIDEHKLVDRCDVAAQKANLESLSAEVKRASALSPRDAERLVEFRSQVNRACGKPGKPGESPAKKEATANKKALDLINWGNN